MLFYQEQLGASFSRANRLRPMHRSLRQFHALSIVLELSMVVLGGTALWHGIDPNEPFAWYVTAIATGLSALFALDTSSTWPGTWFAATG